ncbi:MAG TPA: ROK family protein [Candidatus Dormibacteraeota bacterium]|nr:ROK family protein [Candidatus Dormibacteraeota bacterium]
MKRLVGIDLGGTNIRAALATDATQHGEPVHRSTPAAQGPDVVLAAVAECAREAAGGAIDGAAIGIPGPLDSQRGVVHDAPHLPGWRELAAGPMLSQLLGCPVAVRNDASLAGFAEWKAGAGKGTRHFLFVTASTGIGGALIVDGRLYDGGSGSGGEVGHAPMGLDGPVCSQGHPGCLEGFASGTGIARQAHDAIARGEATALASVAAGALDARAVELAARNGDRVAADIFRGAGRAIGRALGGLINLLSPEVIAVGGGLINAGELLFTPLRAGVGEIAFEYPASRCRILPAGLGTDAGLVGAVAWAVETFESPPAVQPGG